MRALLRAELIKLRTTRTFAALAAAAVTASVVIALLVALLTEPTADSVLADVFQSDTSRFFILILAVVGISGEWRHRTITGSLLAAPDRQRFVSAKAIAFGTAGAVLSVLISIAVTVVGVTVLSVRGLPLPNAAEIAAQGGRNALVAALLGMLGVAVGALVRHQIVAVVAVLALSLIIEPVVTSLAPAVGRFGPTGALPIAAAGFSAEEAGLDNVDLPGMAPATALLVAWIAVVLTAAAVLLRRRDLE
jgi:ABC-2 type transport system permease protein